MSVPEQDEGGTPVSSTGGVGEFFESAMTAGYPSDATENAVQANLTVTGFGKP